MSLIILAAFMGGVLRGLFGFSSHGREKIFLGTLIAIAITEGIIGMMFGLGLLYLGWINTASFPGQLMAMIIVGYAGADIINSLHKMLYNRRLEF